MVKNSASVKFIWQMSNNSKKQKKSLKKKPKLPKIVKNGQRIQNSGKTQKFSKNPIF